MLLDMARYILILLLIPSLSTVKAQMLLPGSEDEVSTLAFKRWRHGSNLSDKKVWLRVVTDAKTGDTLQTTEFLRSGIESRHKEFGSDGKLTRWKATIVKKDSLVLGAIYKELAKDSVPQTDSVKYLYKYTGDKVTLRQKKAWRKLPQGETKTITNYRDGKLTSVQDYKQEPYGKTELIQADSFIYNSANQLVVIQRTSMFKGKLVKSYARQEFNKRNKKIRVIQTDDKGTIVGITRWYYDDKDSVKAYTIVSGAGMKIQLHDSTAYTRYEDGTVRGAERKRNGKLKYLYRYDRATLSEEAIHFASTGQWTRRTVYNLDTIQRSLTQTYTSAPAKPSELQQVLVIKQRFNSSMQLLSQETRLNDQFVSSFQMTYNKVGLQIGEKELANGGSTLVDKRISYIQW